MNFPLPFIPERTRQPRAEGITMALDKGLSLRQVEDLLTVSREFIDFVKLGWCTSLVYKHLKEKIALYRAANISVYFGGTLFEAFLVRNRFDDFRKFVDKHGLEYVEVSDGSLALNIDQKAYYIRELAKNYQVLSEVGSKDSNIVMAPYKWVECIKTELQAGSKLVVTESRESGTVGVFRASGEVRGGLIDEILHQVDQNKLLFEAPKKEQQAWFINLLGANVNLGNIDPNEVLGLETLRLGLRSDTFHRFLSPQQ